MKTNTYSQISITSEKKLTPQFFFLTMGMIMTLFVSSISLINLLFTSFDKLFPDMLNGLYTYGYMVTDFEGMRTSLSVLIIFFPTYLVLSYFLNKEIKKGISIYNALLYKWGLYIILFCAVLAGIIDLAVLVRYFVSGELTIRFIFKVCTIILVSSLTFLYYFRNLKEKFSKIYTYIFLSISILLTIGAIIVGFLVMGSPQKQRKLQFDQRRIEDLGNIQNQLISFWQQKKRLPERLSELVDPLVSYQSLPQDPEFSRGANYEYKKIGDLEFEICATFALPIPKGIQENGQALYLGNEKRSTPDIATSSLYGGLSNENWNHQIGRTCFNRKIDTERYPPFDSNPKPL